MKDIVIAADIREFLRSSIDESNLRGRNKFFKEEINSYGISIITIRKIIKNTYSKLIKDPNMFTEVFIASCDLVKSKIFEEKIAGIILLGYTLKRNKKEFFDFSVVEKMFDKDINNWALCDTMATDVIAPLIEIQPSYISQIMDWIDSENRWKRRAAIVSIIKAKGLNDKKEITNKILERLKYDNDYFVKKALDWLRRGK